MQSTWLDLDKSDDDSDSSHNGPPPFTDEGHRIFDNHIQNNQNNNNNVQNNNNNKTQTTITLQKTQSQPQSNNNNNNSNKFNTQNHQNFHSNATHTGDTTNHSNNHNNNSGFHDNGMNGLQKSKSISELPTMYRSLKNMSQLNDHDHDHNHNPNTDDLTDLTDLSNNKNNTISREYSYPLPDKPPFCVWLGNLPAEAKPLHIVNYLCPLKLTPKDIRFGRIHKGKYTCAYVDFHNKDDMKKALVSIDCSRAPLFMGRQVEIDINEGIVVNRGAAVSATSSSSSLQSPYRKQHDSRGGGGGEQREFRDDVTDTNGVYDAHGGHASHQDVRFNAHKKENYQRKNDNYFGGGGGGDSYRGSARRNVADTHSRGRNYPFKAQSGYHYREKNGGGGKYGRAQPFQNGNHNNNNGFYPNHKNNDLQQPSLVMSKSTPSKPSSINNVIKPIKILKREKDQTHNLNNQMNKLRLTSSASPDPSHSDESKFNKHKSRFPTLAEDKQSNLNPDISNNNHSMNTISNMNGNGMNGNGVMNGYRVAGKYNNDNYHTNNERDYNYENETGGHYQPSSRGGGRHERSFSAVSSKQYHRSNNDRYKSRRNNHNLHREEFGSNNRRVNSYDRPRSSYRGSGRGRGGPRRGRGGSKAYSKKNRRNYNNMY